MIVVHYLNQFFAGLGGEEAASLPPSRIEGPVGPGNGLRGAGLLVDTTLACGDNYFAEHEADALSQLLAWLGAIKPDVIVCGPAFGSGRYGYACGVLAREADRLGIPAVCAMTPENPGVLAAAGHAYVIPTAPNVAGMRAALPLVAGLARRLGQGEPVGGPADEGYLPRGLRANTVASKSGAERAVEALLAKLAGHPRTEVEPDADRVAPAKPLADLASTTVALVTESGLIPVGNPDRLPSRHADFWLRYPISDVRSLSPESYQSVHAGFDTTVANADPNRLVPLDALRLLEQEGRIGTVYGYLYTTSGVDTPVSAATRFGQEIAAELVTAGVQAAILTGT